MEGEIKVQCCNATGLYRKAAFSSSSIMVGVSVLVFLMLRMIPGDPARLLLGEYANPDETRLRAQLGLDQSYLTQYAIYIKNLLQGDFGKSVRTGAPIVNEIGVRLLATIELSFAAMVIATILGIAAGVVSSVKQYSISITDPCFSPSSACPCRSGWDSC